MHPLIHLAVTRPRLLADHAEAYAGLAVTEFDDASAGWKRRALLGAGALLGLLVAVMLAGVALMLWAVLPAGPPPLAWVLLAVPAAPLLLALACLLALLKRGTSPAFDNLRQQVRADMAMLRETGLL